MPRFKATRFQPHGRHPTLGPKDSGLCFYLHQIPGFDDWCDRHPEVSDEEIEKLGSMHVRPVEGWKVKAFSDEEWAEQLAFKRRAAELVRQHREAEAAKKAAAEEEKRNRQLTYDYEE